MKYIATILVSLIVGCKSKPLNSFYEILNKNFTNFTDTVAYDYSKFFLVPNDTTINLPNSKRDLIVIVDTVFKSSPVISKSLLAELAYRKLIEFIELVNANPKEEVPPSIDLTKIKETGKYILVPGNKTDNFNDKYVGQISFMKPYISKEKAIIIISISSSPKAGLTAAFLFKRLNDDWDMIDKIELERW